MCNKSEGKFAKFDGYDVIETSEKLKRLKKQMDARNASAAFIVFDSNMISNKGQVPLNEVHYL